METMSKSSGSPQELPSSSEALVASSSESLVVPPSMLVVVSSSERGETLEVLRVNGGDSMDISGNGSVTTSPSA